MKLKTEIIALCDYANVSQEGKVNINGIFDELRTEKLPSGFTDKYLVATIHGDADTSYTLNIKLEKNGNGHNLLKPTIINAKTSPNGKHNLIIRLAAVGIEAEGDYYFKIYDGKELVGSTLLKVIKLQKEQVNFRTIN